MKTTKKIALLCIAINIILLLQFCLGTVLALEEDAAYIELEQTVEEAVIEAQGREIQIMAAADCPPPLIRQHINVFHRANLINVRIIWL